MKVKYSKQSQTLCCSNNDFSLTLNVRYCDEEAQQPLILFDPKDVFNFIELEFFGTKSKHEHNNKKYNRFINSFLYQGCSVILDDVCFINATGLKHFFSSLVSHLVLENSSNILIDWKQSKFLNWFLSFDFNSSVLRALGLLQNENSCKFCKTFLSDPEDNETFDIDSSESISKWLLKVESREAHAHSKYKDKEFLNYLVCLLKRAAKEIREIIAIDHLLGQTRSLQAPLANYDPSTDWEESCPLIKLFIEAILTEPKSDLCKIIFKNLILIGNQKKNYPFKPQSAYYIACIIKYLHDKQKILDFLSTIGISVGDNAVNGLEKRQIDEFNSVFWDLGDCSTISAVMDNNQSDFGSKNYNPLHDEHHVDCLNVLQVVKPGGNPSLSKESKEMSSLTKSFIESTGSEQNAGKRFNKAFVSYLIKSEEMLPSDSLVEPKIEDLIPMNLSENSSSLVPESIATLSKKEGNLLRSKLLEEPKYVTYQQNEPGDSAISWNNLNGSKTSLRYLKIGKSTDTHVFLDCLDFLFKTFKTDERTKIFLTLDQALHFKFKNLVTLGKMPTEFKNFFIVILDPFHHQWCLLKCLFSAFENAGLKDLLGILGIDGQKWPNLLGESKNVHKAHGILEVLATSLGTFFMNYFLRRLSVEKTAEFNSLSPNEKVEFIYQELPKFLDELKSMDKTLSVFIELYRFSVLVIQCWESQRIADFEMYINSIKETLPYLMSFNRYNYQHSTLEFLSDISLLGEYYQDLLKSGIMFETMAQQPGKHVSCGYVLELFNKIIKQITPNIDGSGSGWLRNLPRLAFVRQILQNASKANLFSDIEKDPIKGKIPNIEQIAKLRWLLEKRNILNIENNEYSVTTRPAVHIITEENIEIRFLECHSIGVEIMQEFISQVIEFKPVGSFELIRKKLNLKKIVPLPLKRKTSTKICTPLTKAEKQTLVTNLPDDEIPMFSCSMLSPNNGVSPYLGSRKSESGHFILDRYANELLVEMEEFDLIVVDFMALIFTKPPSHIYAAESPLDEFCTWLVSSMLAPSLIRSSTMVVCIDRKDLDEDYPLKCETHKSRETKANGNKTFTKLLGKLLDTDLQIVTKNYIPPYSWMSSDRNVRFQLIFKAFQEIFKNPVKYPFPDKPFCLYVDGFANDGQDLHTKILAFENGSFSVSSSEFSVCLPEADQSIFYIIRKLPFQKCLIRYKDNDILLSSIFQCKDICTSPDQRIYIQNIDTNKKCYDVNQICESISNDVSLSNLKLPVQSLIFAFLIIGFNDYSGKIWGMTTEIAFKALGKLKDDLACEINDKSLDLSNFVNEHLFTLFSSSCKYSLSYEFFKKFIQLLYIVKNPNLFKGIVQLPLPQNVKNWKKSDLMSAFSTLNITTIGDDGKDLLVQGLKTNLIAHLSVNPLDRERLDAIISEGISPLEIDYKYVQKIIWLNKNPRDWCPSELQIKNMYGRSVLTGLLFSCPEYFPPKMDLKLFGYKLDSNNLSLDLYPTLTKVKSMKTVLTSVLKKLGQNNLKTGKRKPKDDIRPKAKRKQSTVDETLIL